MAGGFPNRPLRPLLRPIRLPRGLRSAPSRPYSTTDADWGRLLEFIDSYSPAVSRKQLHELASHRPADPEGTTAAVLRAFRDGAFSPSPLQVADFLATCHVWGLPQAALAFLALARRHLGYVGSPHLYSRLLHPHTRGTPLSGPEVREALAMAAADGVEVDTFLVAKAIRLCCTTNDVVALDLFEEILGTGDVPTGLLPPVLKVALHEAQRLQRLVRTEGSQQATGPKAELKRHLHRSLDVAQVALAQGHDVPAEVVTRLQQLMAGVQHPRLREVAQLLQRDPTNAELGTSLQRVYNAATTDQMLDVLNDCAPEQGLYLNVFQRMGHLGLADALDVWMQMQPSLRPTKELYTALFFALSRSSLPDEREVLEFLYGDMVVDVGPAMDGRLLAAYFRLVLRLKGEGARRRAIQEALQDVTNLRIPLPLATLQQLAEAGFEDDVAGLPLLDPDAPPPAPPITAPPPRTRDTLRG